MGELYDLGVRIFTDDGACVADAGVMRRASSTPGAARAPSIAQHAEDPGLAGGGHMHEGRGRAGSASRAARRRPRTSIVARDVMLAELTGTPVPLPPPVDRRRGRTRACRQGAGVPVTAEVHAPPLHAHRRRVPDVRPGVQGAPAADRRRRRRGARGLADGTIDAIATDHAPHVPEAKERPFEEAPPGMLGLETALALASPSSWSRASSPRGGARALSWQPAAIAGLDGPRRTDRAGPPANLCVFDPAVRWEVDPSPPREPVAEHAVRRPQAHRQGPPHGPAGRAGGRRRHANER